MKISNALNQMNDLDIAFGSETLHIVYRPSAVTLADIERLKHDRDPMRLAEQIREQVVQWDLESDRDGRIVPLLKPESPLQVMEEGKELPSESLRDPIVDEVPISVMVKILIEIQKAQQPDPQR